MVYNLYTFYLFILFSLITEKLYENICKLFSIYIPSYTLINTIQNNSKIYYTEEAPYYNCKTKELHTQKEGKRKEKGNGRK